MRVEWLRTALKNLDDEAAYIAVDNPQSAVEFVLAIRAGVEQLALFPAMGREGRLSGTREWVLPDRPYIIPYRVRGGCLQILRIFHTRRLPPSSW
ncbi:type II toxin-antitoxin system RelE/ParE family toxin [Pseudomonas cichorii]|uniref:Type II toxin-antitoxin system RelE/ParE family toxin n=1 Tax=Pseudomonas lijiangensis TaxID=2995658 RepID=A0ABX8HPC6_9PSED|nr:MULTISPECIES: type II toxin-antitoxin system RelE/ParE family toxin [Pseudomonas syringae group]MBX8489626.1 type II toxin-antitoxin system RelE/ParE family toxin [Pseudomonas cichorii]MBX8500195.1 type II toxin-antitoxin system RelE/ParE family toxin [Pseudomonas lijiangensis]MBX8505446.1 type II toxin-antitoxin system RelE/ParE family toxin [Pseudomonas lijiangensis]MBX8509389.1 type II toxin-antitoxin system RelE/ParE family toxin [Pseudomonas cichorii]MBX8522950.1 type II toxin-antitoxi